VSPDGRRRENGAARASGDTVTQPVNGTLPDGTYTVGWRVVSVDGHPVTGTYKFTVKGSPAGAPAAGPAQAPGAAPSTSGPAADGSGTGSPAAGQGSDGSSSGWLWIGLAGLVVVLGVGGVAWARRPGQD
jgi:hypothetical protein